MAELVASDVCIHYDADGGQGVTACDGVEFRVEEGELVALVGRSGCGKTSLLYAIDGLLPLADGVISVGGRDVTGPGPDRAVVFQSPTLFPWRSVAGNIKFGIEASDRHGADAKARELVRLVGLDGFEDHHPHQLSGGMQQRVNLARALAVDPDVLLLDEPFSALDAQTRDLMQTELLRVWSTRNAGERRLTTVFVTHDIGEAVYLADRIIVFSPHPGRVLAEIAVDLERPRSPATKNVAEYREHVATVAALIAEDGT